MKHIGTCLDNIQIALAQIPRNVDSHEDKARAFKIVDEIQEYAHTLEQLVMNPNLRTYLYNLEKAPIDGIRLQAHEVEELLKDLKHMLYILDLYIKNLRDIIRNHSGAWTYKAKQIFIAICHMFNSKKVKLGREYSTAENFKALVRKLLNQWGYKADQLALAIDQKFGGENGELRREFKIALYKMDELKKIVKSEKHLLKFLK